MARRRPSDTSWPLDASDFWPAKGTEEAYRHLESLDDQGGDAVNEFLEDWLEESRVKGWGDFGQIERLDVETRCAQVVQEDL